MSIKEVTGPLSAAVKAKPERMFGNLPSEAPKRTAGVNKNAWGLKLPDGSTIPAGLRRDAVGLSNSYPGSKVIKMGPANKRGDLDTMGEDDSDMDD